MTYNHDYTVWQNIWYCAKRNVSQQGGRFYIPAFLNMLMKAALPLAMASFPSVLIELLTKKAGTSQLITTVLLFVITIGIISLCGSLAQIYHDHAMMLFRVRDIALFRKYLTLSYKHLENKQAGIDFEEAQKSHYQGSYQGIELMLISPILILGAIISILLYGSITYTLHPILVIVLLGCSAIHAICISQNAPFEKKMLWEQVQLYYPHKILSRHSMRLKYAQDIRSYQANNWFHDKDQAYVKQHIAHYDRVHRRRFLIQIVGRISVFIRDILCYGYLLYKSAHGLDLASFTLYLSIFAGFTGYFETIIQQYWNLINNTAYITAFRNYLMEPDHIPLTGSHPIGAGPHSFTFDDVCFTYPESETPVLQHVNFTIHAGEKVALVGLNGAGKTTLIKLLSGLYIPDSGRVLMDGIDIREYNAEEYYRCIGTVFQDDFAIAFPLTENVTCIPDGEENESRLWKCLDLAGLGNKIRSFPKHIHTYLYQNIDPNGILLSGGEMQRLMLARALYKDADTLILDEPTAALDPLAEAAMYSNYAAMSDNKTSVFISHRLSSTRFCNRILFLQDGHIAEEGTHQSLLEADGLYAALFNTQAQYYQKEAPVL